jgi:hypothetical protein
VFGDLLFRGAVVVVDGATVVVVVVVVVSSSVGMVVVGGAVVVVTGVSFSTKLAIVRLLPGTLLAVSASLIPLDEIPG